MYTRFLQMLKRPENIFLFFCLLGGLLLVFINPSFQGFDETEHFYKIYGFSQGTLNYKKITSYTDGTLLYEKPKTFTAQIVPLSIVQLAAQSKLLNPYIGPDRIIHAPQKSSIKNVQELAKIPLNKQYKTIAIHMIPSYTVFSYLPHTFAMIIMNSFDVPPVFMIFILRLCSLFLYTGLMYIAIKITPVKKNIFLFSAIAPLSLYIASIINTDHLVAGVAFILTAYTLKLKNDYTSDTTKQISTKELLIFFALIFFLCVCKFAYFPMILLYFAIPKNCFESNKKRVFTFILIFLACSLWITGFVVYTIQIFNGTFSYYCHNALRAIVSIFQHPAGFIGCLLKTTAVNFIEYIQRAVSDFGVSDTNVNPLIIWGYFALLIANSVFGDKNIKDTEYNLDLQNKIIFAVIITLVYILALTADYITFTLDGNGLIAGFKGRYLLPVLPLFLFLFYTNKYKTTVNLPLITLVYSAMFVCIFVFTIIQRYYVF